MKCLEELSLNFAQYYCEDYPHIKDVNELGIQLQSLGLLKKFHLNM